jgi:hypothetical protein
VRELKVQSEIFTQKKQIKSARKNKKFNRDLFVARMLIRRVFKEI